MVISKNCIVTLDYTVCDSDGDLVDEGTTPIEYLHGGYDDIFPKIESMLEGKSVKDTLEVEMLAKEAFGEYDDKLVEVEDIANMPEGVQVGMHIEGSPADDDGAEALLYTVTDIHDDRVVLDANHPLAGMDLMFSCTVIAIREASSDEIASALSRQVHQ